MKQTYNTSLTSGRIEPNDQNIPDLSPNLASSQLCDLDLSSSLAYNSLRAQTMFHFLLNLYKLLL